MKRWYETKAAAIGLRAGGLILLAIGAWSAIRLHQLALTNAHRDTASLVLAAICFLCASAGSALVWEGPGLWAPVEVSERWRRSDP